VLRYARADLATHCVERVWRKDARRKFLRYANHVELKICRGFEQDMIVTRRPAQDIACVNVEHLISHAKLGAPFCYPVELGFRMEVSRAGRSGHVSPDMATCRGRNWERLVEDTVWHNRPRCVGGLMQD